MKKVIHDRSLVRIRRTRPNDIEPILALARKAYPGLKTLAREQIESQIQQFPEGQILAEDRNMGQILGASGNLVIPSDRYKLTASWNETTANGSFKNHDLKIGRTLMNAFCLVDPQHGQLEVRKRLYRAIIRLGTGTPLKRIRTGIWVPRNGNAASPDASSKDAYQLAQRISRGSTVEPAIATPVSEGFVVLAVIPEYLAVSSTVQCGALAQYDLAS